MVYPLYIPPYCIYFKLAFNHPLQFLIFRETFEEERLLTPLTDNENMGGLVPVSPLDNALDDTLVSLPSYVDVSTMLNW
jgi:hypothetical protein